MANPKKKKHNELNPEDLRWKCDPAIFEFDSTEDLKPLEGILGQERALKAIKLGVDLRSPGYNIYIAGLSGSGKATTVKKMLETISSNCPPLQDYAYVNNFQDPDRPILLTFQTGKAKIFKQNLYDAVQLLKKKIPQVLEGEIFLARKNKIVSIYNEKEQYLMDTFQEKLKQDSFTLGQVKVGEDARPDVIPLIEDKPVPIFQIDEQIQAGKITKESAQEVIKKYTSYQQELQSLFKKGLKLNQEYQGKIFKLEREAVDNVVKGVLESLREEYRAAKIITYLEQVEESILENIQIFKGTNPENSPLTEGYIIDYFREYEVNVILDNSQMKSCPIIIETSPNYMNLFGSIEKINDGKGGWFSDFTNIKGGSLLQANNGYLVLNVNHLFEEPGVWKFLKRVLTYRQLEIQEPYSIYQISPTTLKPEPINIDTKVILIGSANIYSWLAENEYDFKKIFKVKADFDYEIKRSDEVLIQYARVIKKLIKEDNLLEFDKTAIAYLIEISARFSGRKDKLTTRFSKIADLAREASFWAVDDGFSVVSAAHVKKAFEYAKDRHGMLESKINNMFEDETFLIDTEGSRIGQINGLAVYGSDYYSFGRPTRITATVSLGSGNIINVEREAGMSGRHYNKGVLIISGYFKETFGQDLPLAFNANLVFEQSYGTVDGDSASCAEIFALLSVLADLPIKQSIAVTGSLNQKGDVQPIGGVNEKIEGFYDVCKMRGLNRKQGVIIPIQNVKELMLKDEVISAVKKKMFHIYPISKVEEGIEILTDVKAGDPSIRPYEKGTVFYLVEEKIKNLYAKARAQKVSPEKAERKLEAKAKQKVPIKKVVKRKK